MIEFLVTLIIYFLLSTFSLKSFLMKETYRASISSLSAFLGFSLYFIDSFLSMYQIIHGLDIKLNFIAVNLDILGTVCLFFTTTKIRGIITSNVSLIKIKLLNLLFFVFVFILIYTFNFVYIYSINQYVIEPMLFYNYTLNIIYFGEISLLLILMIIHLPFIEKYKFIVMAVVGFAIKYLLKTFNEIFPIPNFSIIELSFSIIFTFILLITAKSIYLDSYKLNK